MNQHFDCALITAKQSLLDWQYARQIHVNMFHSHPTATLIFYYFYFIDKDFGLCYLLVPTWTPFRLKTDDRGQRAEERS
jgi:hypothetical protein